MKIIDCEQGSPEWLAARLGKVTASRVSDVTAKGGGACRARYMAELISERLTGLRRDGFKSASMERGNEQEESARRRYQFMADMVVSTVGLVLHPTIDNAAASPDGLAGDQGIVQFKCPDTHTHIDTLRGGSVPGSYQKQMQWEMACTGRAWCDFVSFDPRMPEDMQMRIIRFPRDPKMIVDLEREVRAFLAEVDANIADLLARYRQHEAAE